MSEKSKLLDHIPDLSSWDEAQDWFLDGLREIQRITPSQVLEAEIQSLEWSEIEQNRQLPFGLYASDHWRKFALAAFLADIASYPKPSDQVNFERLLFVMNLFPEGFRVWWIKLANDVWWPVGYTGWYPMYKNIYDFLKMNPEKLRDRMVQPNTHMTEGHPYLYLFNFSVAPLLKKSRLSRELMKSFILDICSQQPAGMACITVSDDGIRISNRIGMTCAGYLEIDDSSEGVYIK